MVLADRLLPAFNTPTGLMENSVNLHTGAHQVAPWSLHRAATSSFWLDKDEQVMDDLKVYSDTFARGIQDELFGDELSNVDKHYVCLADGKIQSLWFRDGCV